MEQKTKKDINTSDLYANVLGKGRIIGIIVLFVTYLMYVLNIIQPFIPIDQLQNLWNLNINEFLARTNMTTGWNWVTMLGFSDFMNYIGISILTGITIVCYIFIIPKFFKMKDYIYFTIALLEIIVLISAASGILITSH